MTALEIDRLSPTDKHAQTLAEGISRLVEEINAERSTSAFSPGVALPPAMSAEEVITLAKQMGDQGGIFYCADGADVVAFAMARPDMEKPGTAVMGVWVRASHRRKGIGTELARAGTEFIRDAGYKKLRGTIPAGNERALSFFSAIGPIVTLEAGTMGYELPVDKE